MILLAYLGPLATLATAIIILILLFNAYNATNFGGLLVLIGAALLDVFSALVAAAFNFSVFHPGGNSPTHTTDFYRLLGSVQLGIRCLALGLTTLGLALLLQEFVKLARERAERLPKVP